MAIGSVRSGSSRPPRWKAPSRSDDEFVLPPEQEGLSRTIERARLQGFFDGPGRDRTCDLGIKSPAAPGACSWLKHWDSSHLQRAHSRGPFWRIWAVAAPGHVA